MSNMNPLNIYGSQKLKTFIQAKEELVSVPRSPSSIENTKNEWGELLTKIRSSNMLRVIGLSGLGAANYYLIATGIAAVTAGTGGAGGLFILAGLVTMLALKTLFDLIVNLYVCSHIIEQIEAADQPDYEYRISENALRDKVVEIVLDPVMDPNLTSIIQEYTKNDTDKLVRSDILEAPTQHNNMDS